MKVILHSMISLLVSVIVHHQLIALSNMDYAMVGNSVLKVISIGRSVKMVPHRQVRLLLVRRNHFTESNTHGFRFTLHLDHTLSSKTGHFLYIDTNGRATGDDAQLVSPSYKGSQPRCLHLWYHLYGAEQGIIQIQQKPELGRAKTLWTKTNDQGEIFDHLFLYNHCIILRV